MSKSYAIHVPSQVDGHSLKPILLGQQETASAERYLIIFHFYAEFALVPKLVGLRFIGIGIGIGIGSCVRFGVDCDIGIAAGTTFCLSIRAMTSAQPVWEAAMGVERNG